MTEELPQQKRMRLRKEKLKEIIEDWAELKIEAFQNRRSWVRATPSETIEK